MEYTAYTSSFQECVYSRYVFKLFLFYFFFYFSGFKVHNLNVIQSILWAGLPSSQCGEYLHCSLILSKDSL